MSERVLVVCSDPVAERMNGPAIRAWHMAEVLAGAGCDVRLVSTVAASRRAEAFEVAAVEEPQGMGRLREWAGVVVTNPGALRTHPLVGAGHGAVVVDLYDPFHLENLEAGDEMDAPARAANVAHLRSVMDDSLRRGDFFLAATERQRDFWLGSLMSAGRINPATYDADPTFRRLIDLVPFGISAAPPVKRRPVLRGVVEGIGADDLVLLWGGGVYNWFDPVTLVEAVDVVRQHVPRVRLVFLGMTNPNPAIPPMRVAVEVRERAAALGLVGTHVFFNDGWVPYDERADYLLEADVGVSTHRSHIEASFSFRTRVLDYLWAGLPYVTSAGDSFADLADAEGVGVSVPGGDVGALGDALVALLTSPDSLAACRAAASRVVGRFHWDAVMAPLVAFCLSPRRAADSPRSPAGAAPSGPRRRRGWRRGGEAAT